MNKHTLIRVFKEFKMNSMKVFVISDFKVGGSSSYFREKYLNTLKTLGIIEEVPAIYYAGNKMQIRKTVKGYRIKPTYSSVCKKCGYINNK